MILEDLIVDELLDTYDANELRLRLRDVESMCRYMDEIRVAKGYIPLYYGNPGDEIDEDGWYDFKAECNKVDKTVKIYAIVENSGGDDYTTEYDIPPEALGVSDIDVYNYLDCQCFINWNMTIEDLLTEVY